MVGFEVDASGIVRVAPPIIAWAINKPVGQFAAWARRKGATISRIDSGG